MRVLLFFLVFFIFFSSVAGAMNIDKSMARRAAAIASDDFEISVFPELAVCGDTCTVEVTVKNKKNIDRFFNLFKRDKKAQYKKNT